MVKRGRFKKLMKVMRYKNRDKGLGNGPSDETELVIEERFQLEPLKGEELVVAQQIQSQVTHKACCRRFPGANSQMFLTYEDRTFHVESVTNRGERNKFLDWQLVEEV